LTWHHSNFTTKQGKNSNQGMLQGDCTLCLNFETSRWCCYSHQQAMLSTVPPKRLKEKFYCSNNYILGVIHFQNNVTNFWYQKNTRVIALQYNTTQFSFTDEIWLSHNCSKFLMIYQ